MRTVGGAGRKQAAPICYNNRSQFETHMPLKVLVSGSSGVVGSALVLAVRAVGHDVKRLVRRAVTARDEISWNPAELPAPQSLSGFDAVIHLAGESIAARWTEAKKRRIIESRVPATRHLAEALTKAQPPPRLFMCASAVGYYGDRGDEVLREDSPSEEGSPPTSAANGKLPRNPWPVPAFARCS